MNGLYEVLAPGLSLPADLATLTVVLIVTGARAVGFVMICPVFGRFGISRGFLRGAVVVAMTAPVLGTASAQVMAEPELISTISLPLVVLRETIIGAVLGFLVGIPFWAVLAAGDFIDMQRGASMANIMDPGSSSEASVTGTFYFMVCVLVLAAEGVLFPTLFGPLLKSYAMFPVLQPFELPDPRQGALALQMLDQILRAGLLLALPVLVPLLLAEMVLVVGTKYMPQINAMFLAMSVKQIVHALLLLIYTVIVARYAISQIGHGALSPDALSPFLKGVVE